MKQQSSLYLLLFPDQVAKNREESFKYLIESTPIVDNRQQLIKPFNRGSQMLAETTESKQPFIQNVSMHDISKGFHYYVPNKTALIQLQDYYSLMKFATPVYAFVKVLQLRFDDDDIPNLESNINQGQAKVIAYFLKECLEAEINIVVHCHAGLCRSGAVAECGIILGFKDTEVIRIPNILVKKLTLEELGMSNSYEGEPKLTEEQKFYLRLLD